MSTEEALERARRRLRRVRLERDFLLKLVEPIDAVLCAPFGGTP